MVTDEKVQLVEQLRLLYRSLDIDESREDRQIAEVAIANLEGQLYRILDEEYKRRSCMLNPFAFLPP